METGLKTRMRAKTRTEMRAHGQVDICVWSLGHFIKKALGYFKKGSLIYLWACFRPKAENRLKQPDMDSKPLGNFPRGETSKA